MPDGLQGLLSGDNRQGDTYASMPWFISLELLILIGLTKNYSFNLGDSSAAFLRTELKGEFNAQPPAEFYPKGGVLWDQRKAMCGLKTRLKSMAVATRGDHG